MRKSDRFARVARAALLVSLVGGVGACASVKPEEMEASMASLRAEMQAGDSELSRRLDGVDGRVDDLERQLAQLEMAMEDLAAEFDATVELMAEAVRFNVPVRFAFDDATVTADQAVILDRFAAVVAEYYPGYVVTAEGFTDAVGDVNYNMALGLRRAQAVRAHLTEQGGLDADRVRAVSYGEAPDRLVSPGAHGPGPAGRENRRVSLVVEHVGAASVVAEAPTT